MRINKATEGFRKLYVGALTANTTEKDLEQYFSSFGNVDFVQVIRSKDTGQTKGRKIEENLLNEQIHHWGPLLSSHPIATLVFAIVTFIRLISFMNSTNMTIQIPF